ncbi:hypothetical protein QAD02_020350 [Eretmocerus hayati]|uniref:Uncharacterized protein n=1 Tax=Eretmocerus hayati TaxID=131215 RepID=A0ACC2PN79_9HYME|nr:hypothetical protein QAD02_020350 [Eretmocerus hayati]
MEIFGDEFTFYPRKKKPDILFSTGLEDADKNDMEYDHLSNLIAMRSTSDMGCLASGLNIQVDMNLSEKQILHRVACFLQESIREIPQCRFYPTPCETLQEKSEEFMPELLKNLMPYYSIMERLRVQTLKRHKWFDVAQRLESNVLSMLPIQNNTM